MTLEHLKAINWKEFKVLDVLKGCGEAFFGDFIGKSEEQKEVVKYRVRLCSNCSLYNNGYCDPNRKGVNVRTGKERSGCGCFISCKTALKSSECPLAKWLSIK